MEFLPFNTACLATAIPESLVVRVKLQIATPDRAAAIAAFRLAVADELTARFGTGPWSSPGTEKGVLLDMHNGVLYVATYRNQVVASLRVCTRKPWAIDPAYFSKCSRPLYLLSMAVRPDLQRQGIGTLCLKQAVEFARKWPADAIRLDAYDHAAGAGEFYRKCGFAERDRVVYRKAPLVYYELML